MKKTIFAMAAVAASVALAAPEKVLDVRVTSQNGLVEACGRIGKFIEYPSLASMALMGLAQNPLAEEYGALRPDAGLRFVVYADAATFDMDKVDECVAGALLYPTTLSKAEFLAKHGEDAKETENGAVEYSGDTLVFAEQGGWFALPVGKNKDVALAKTLLAEAVAPLSGGDIATVDISAAFGPILKKVAESQQGAVDADALKLIDSLGAWSAALRVTDAGIDLAGSFAFAPGSELSKLGGKTLAPGTALAFAGKDASFASAYAADMGQAAFDAQVSKVITVLSQHGIATGSFLKYKKTGSVARFDFDARELVKYLTEGGCALTGTVDELMKDIGDAFGGQSFTAASPELFVEEYFAGIAPAEAPAARFAKAMPEAAARPLASASVFSVYGIFKDVFGQILAAFPDEASSEFTAVKSAYSALPAADGATVATMTYKDGDRLCSTVRLTPNEVKGLYQTVLACIPLYQMFAE